LVHVFDELLIALPGLPDQLHFIRNVGFVVDSGL
jgi:hypothetical protein